MLSDFENQLYGVAKAAGFTSLDETNEVMVRHVIEWYLIEIIWKCTPRVKNLLSLSSPLVPILKQVADVAPEDDVIELVKTKLDLNLYNLNDGRVDGLLPVLKADDADGLSRALDAEPQLVYRRNNNMRSLLHEAIILRKLWAVELLLRKGASLQQRCGAGSNALELAVQHYFIGGMIPLLYPRVRQYVLLETMIAYGSNEYFCLKALQEKQEFLEPVTLAEKISLMHLAIEKRYYQFVKNLVLDQVSPNSPDSAGMMPLYHHVKEDLENSIKFDSRAQVLVPGFVSFLLAAGAKPDQADVREGSLLTVIEEATQAGYQNWDGAVDVGILSQCLLAMGDFPIIMLKQADYSLLKNAGLLLANRATYVVIPEQGFPTIHYEKNGAEQTLIWDALPFFLQNTLHQLRKLIYPASVTVLNMPILSVYASNLFDTRKYFFAHLSRQTRYYASQLQNEVVDFIYPCEKKIQWLRSLFRNGPIVLRYLEVRAMMIEAMASKRNMDDFFTFIYNNIQLDKVPENIKYLLYYATVFEVALFKQFVIDQPFDGSVSFYQIMKHRKVFLQKNFLFEADSIEREAYDQLNLAEKNKPIDEIDILKGVKAVYLRRVREGINDPQWKEAHIAIRDSLVLVKPTLFLNVFRTNSKLTELKDTNSYSELCELMRETEISPEAKAELAKRVLPKAEWDKPAPYLRDVVLFLALVCDFEADKATFIQVCRDYLLGENVSDLEKKPVNDALRLLSNKEHNQLRDRLVAVSADPIIRPVLQERLPKKNCAFIDIVRTSETDRKLMKTKTYKELVAALGKEKHFHVPSTVAFFPPKHSANFDNVLSQDERFYSL